MSPATVTSWTPVDLVPVLDGIVTGTLTGPQPLLMPRADGVRLLYGGELHSLAGEPESGKGWLALGEAARVIEAGARVLYLDFEDSPVNITGRLIALGAEPSAIAEHFVYVAPADPLPPRALATLLRGKPFALAILDGMTEAYALLGLDDKNTAVPQFLRMLPRPIAATGAAILVIDHVTKSKEGRGRFAIGAQHKLAGVAVAYGVEVLAPPSRTSAGKLKLTIHKDRHGHIRGHATHGVIAIARIEPTDDGHTVTVTLDTPDDTGDGANFRPTVLMQRASEAIEASPGLTSRELRALIKGAKSDYKDIAVQTLAREGYIEIREEGRARRHYHLATYRTDDDCAHVPDRASNVPGTSESDRALVPHPLRGAQGTTHTNGNNNGATVPQTLPDGIQR
jgi:hypothetical protein